MDTAVIRGTSNSLNELRKEAKDRLSVEIGGFLPLSIRNGGTVLAFAQRRVQSLRESLKMLSSVIDVEVAYMERISSALSNLAAFGDPEIVGLLLRNARVQLNAPQLCYCPLFRAVFKQHDEIVYLLLQQEGLVIRETVMTLFIW